MVRTRSSIDRRVWRWRHLPRLFSAIGALAFLALSLILYKFPWTAPDWHPLSKLLCLIAALVLVCWPRIAPGRCWLVTMLVESPARRLNPALFLLATASFAYLSHKLFQAVPHMDDGVVALYQARLFLHGTMMWPVAEAIQPYFKIFGLIGVAGAPGYWSCMYPPGWPALLALGELIRLPWLVNPLLGGGLAVAVVGLGEELFDRRVGRLAGLLLVLSPFVGVLSATHLSHISTAFFCTLAWWAILRLLRTSRVRFGLVAGFSLAVAFLERPVSALLMGGIIGLGVFFQPRLARGARRGIMAAVLVLVVAAATLAVYQERMTGNPLMPGHVVGMGSSAMLGFGRVGDTGRIHSPGDAFRSSVLRLHALNRHLLGWPIASLLLVVAPFVLLVAGARDHWLIAPLLALLLFLSIYWYFGGYYHGRYLMAGVPMLFILAARGWHVLSEFCRGRRVLNSVPAVLLAWGMVYSLAVGAPEYHRLYGPNHGDVESVLPQVVESYGVRKALVFMESVGEDPRGWDVRNDYYATGFMRNNLELDGDLVFARNAKGGLGASEALIARYPGRDYYLYQFDRRYGRSRLYRYNLDRASISGRIPVEPHDGLLLDGIRIEYPAQQLID